MMKLWETKNGDGSSESANWILVNTKRCPKCEKRIDKNGGCNHMSCPCGHQFCWICMKNWKGHKGCNAYIEEKDGKMELVKKELDKYIHHYARYKAHERAQTFAETQLKEGADEVRVLQYLEENAGTSWREVDFLRMANRQLVECRRVMKFTYVFAYYMKDKAIITDSWMDLNMDGDPKRELGTKLFGVLDNCSWKKQKHKHVDRNSSRNEEEVAKRQKEQFEEHQNMLEQFTEELSQMVELPVAQIDRNEVINKTKFVKQYLKNILLYVEEQF